MRILTGSEGMNKRLLVVTVLVMLVIGGMFMGLFAGTIQKALTLPMMQGRTESRAPANTHIAAKNMKTPTANIMPTGKAQTTVQGQNTVLAQDTFQRTNQTLWGTASDGIAWQGDANTQQAFSITGASGMIAHSQGTFNALLGPANDNTEVKTSGTVNHFGNGINFGTVLRYQDQNNWYKAFIDGTNFTLVKHVAGHPIQIQNVAFATQDNVAYTIRFRCVGAMLFAKVWRASSTEPGGWMITANDNSFMTGQSGVRVVVQADTVINITAFTASVATMGNVL